MPRIKGFRFSVRHWASYCFKDYREAVGSYGQTASRCESLPSWGWLSSGMLRRVFWKILTDVPEVLTVSIIRAIALMMEVISTSESVVSMYQTTRRDILEDSHLHTCRRDNLKSYWHPSSYCGLKYGVFDTQQGQTGKSEKKKGPYTGVSFQTCSLWPNRDRRRPARIIIRGRVKWKP
jgi:hypothetical protein